MYKTIIGHTIQEAANYLLQDELVAIPTETVYGLAANAYSDTALKKVFTVKQRPVHNPLIVHLDSFEKLRLYVTDIPAAAKELIQHFTAGPLTLILPTNGRLSSFINNGKRLVAFRVPAHPVANALLKELPFPLAAPSANLFTTISPTHPRHVLKNFDGKIPYILDGGACEVGIESTVVGFEEEGTTVVYRQGAITPAELEKVAGRVKAPRTANTTISPGLMLHHYAPKTPLYLVDRFSLEHKYNTDRVGILCFDQFYHEVPRHNQFILSEKGNLQEAARNLYRGLHYLDELKLDVLIAERCPADELGNAINDRLQRAAFHHRQPDGLLA